MTKLVLEFIKRESDDETKYSTIYSNSKAEIVFTENEIDDAFE